MKIRCDFCGGRFGLIRRRYFGYHFCKEACERAWREKRENAIADFKRWLYGSPA